MNPDVLLNRIRLEQRGLIDIHKSCTKWSICCLCPTRCSLQTQMGLPRDQVHIAKCGDYRCEQIIRICENATAR